MCKIVHGQLFNIIDFDNYKLKVHKNIVPYIISEVPLTKQFLQIKHYYLILGLYFILI